MERTRPRSGGIGKANPHQKIAPTGRTTRAQLISDARIPEDRRVLYALKALAGLRHGEVAGLTWRQYDATLEPLGGLSLERTKTQVPRRVPVHPTLARALAEWKLSAWRRKGGRMAQLVLARSTTSLASACDGILRDLQRRRPALSA
jgi:integrase